ncbi:PAS domain-containing sensor histidine kinase, partial [Desulfovibrio oxamicus]
GPQREAARKGVPFDAGGDGCRGGCIPEHRVARGRGRRLRVSGPCVCVTVADTGTGIAPAVLDRVFEPFFTTKPEGKGTGLGLSISYGIVKSHGGTLMLDSDGVSGSRAVVVLPEAPPELPQGAGARAPAAPDTPDTHASGRQVEVAHGEDTAR